MNKISIQNPFPIIFAILLAAILLILATPGWAQNYQSFDASTTNALTASKWSTSSTTNACVTTGLSNGFTTGRIAYFCTVNGTGSGATGISVGGIIATENYTHSSPSGTFATNGAVATINIASGKQFDLGNGAISTAAGTGFNKTGAGAFAMSGAAYTGGFTLGAGTIIARGNNTMGSGGLLTLNGGTVAANNSRDFTGKYTNIIIGGDVQFGEVTTNVPLASGAANLTFSNTMSLGAATRTLTLGGSGTITFGGVISNTATNGLTFTANANGTGRFDVTNTANTFTGPININGDGATGVAEVRFTADGSLGNTSNTININGGRLATLSGATYTLTTGRGIQVGNTAGTSISTPGAGVLTYDGVIADLSGFTPGAWAKQGGGTLSLGGVSTYTGNTSINNGVLQLTTGNNRLPTGTVVNLGQAASANLGIFNLNARNQQVAGLNSTTGTNATASNNTVTSVSAATLTLGGSGTYSYGDGTNANSGVITGAVSIIKSGAGSQTFGDANTYSGTTDVNAGTLFINGIQTGTGNASVAGSATLGGSGTLPATLTTLSGTLSPGTAVSTIGTLTTGAFAFAANSHYTFELSNVSSSWDKIVSSGAIDVSASNINIDFSGTGTGFSDAGTYSWIIASGASISGFNVSNFILNNTFTPSFTGTFAIAQSGNDIVLNYTPLTVNTNVNFTATSSSVSEGVGTTSLTVSIANYSVSAATTVDIAITGGTGTNADVNTYTTQTLTFPANSSANQSQTITVTDDVISEGTETIIFTLQNVLGGQGTPAIGGSSSHTLTINDNDNPVIAVTPASLTGFTTTSGTASTHQTFDLSGDFLTGNLTVSAAPTGFEISIDGGANYFSTSQTGAVSSGNVTGEPLTIRVRISASASAGSPSGNITISGGGATSQTVAVSGTVTGGVVTQNFSGSNTAFNTSNWSVNNSTCTGSNSFTSGNTAGFCTVNGTGTGSVAITVGGITATENYTHSAASGTLATGGTVVTVDVASSKSFNLGTAAISTVAGTGFIKAGSGAYQTGGAAFTGGFTVNAGTMLLGGVNAMGAGGALTLNGGTIAGTANRDLSGKYTGGITIGGNIQFGEMSTVWANANSTANLTFSDNMSLGSSLRTLTLGNGGNMAFGGIISNTGSAGITFTANTNGTGRFDITNAANTFTGPININGDGGTGVAEVRFTADGSLGNVANTININGGRLSTLNSATYTLTSGRGIQVGNTTGTSISTPGTGTLTFNGVISDLAGFTPGSWAKQGTGTLILGGNNTYTGTTTVNNGTLLINGNPTGSGAFSVVSTVSNTGTLGGSGTLTGSVTLTGFSSSQKSTVSPGSASGVTGTLTTGAFTFGAYSSYKFEINNATGTAGAANGWDKIVSTGAINVSATPITIDLTSVSITNFTNSNSYQWIIASGTSITGFSSANFTVSVTNFAPVLAGTFNVLQSGNNIILDYTPSANATYYSQSGGLHDGAIWATTLVGTPGTATFSSTTSFVVQSGHVVNLNGSSIDMKNLTVDAGGTLKANSTNPTFRYLNIYGNLVFNGTIGNGTGNDGIGFNIEGAGTQTLTGTGTIDIARIRKNGSANTTSSLTINANINLRYGGTAIYNNSNSTSLNITIGNGYIVNVIGDNGTNGDVSIDGVSGNSSNNRGGSITVNGSLIVSNKIYAFGNNISTYSCSMSIGNTGTILTKDIDLNIDGTSFTAFNITSGGMLTVTNLFSHRGGTLTTNGGVTINDGGTLLHGSGTNYPGGPFSGGTISGSINYKRQGQSSGTAYNMWSTPVNASVSIPGSNKWAYNSAAGTHDFHDDGGPNYDGVTYLSTQDPGWVAATTMSNALGYASQGGGLATFTGNPNDGDKPVTLSRSGYSYSGGNWNLPGSDFNLVGNPYPGPIAVRGASGFLTLNSSKIDAVYLYANAGSNQTQADYSIFNSSGFVGGNSNANPNDQIGACQGFFVRCISAGNIQFTNAMRNSGTNTFFKTEEEPYMNRIWLDLYNDTKFNEILVAFKDDATEQADNYYDAPKIRGTSPIVFSAIQEEGEFSIVAFPTLTAERIVPLNVFLVEAGEYTIKNRATENMESIPVYLEDRELGIFTDISNLGEYTASINSGENTGRFFLHFAPMITSTGNTPAEPVLVAYTSGSELYVQFSNFTENSGTLVLRDVAGRELFSKANFNTQNGITGINTEAIAQGVYFVTLYTANNKYTKKIVIR